MSSENRWIAKVYISIYTSTRALLSHHHNKHLVLPVKEVFVTVVSKSDREKSLSTW
jgi:hypothetical protein